MQLFIFSLVVLGLYFGTLYGFKFWLHRQSEERLTYALEPAIAAFMTGSMVLGFAASVVLFGAPSVLAYGLIIAALCVLLFLNAKWPLWRAKLVWGPLMCLAGTFILHQIFPDMSAHWGMIVLQALVWLAVMVVVMCFDGLPMLSFLTMGAWSFAFLVTAYVGIVPAPLAIAAVLLFVPMWSLTSVLAKYSFSGFGRYGAVLLGYVMGGIAAVCVGFEAYASVPALMGYYVFEMLFFGLAWFGLKPLSMQKGDFIYVSIFEKDKGAYLIKTVFYHLIILAFVAAIMWRSEHFWLTLLLVVIVLLDLYNRFRVGRANPSIKEMLRETKEVMATAIKNITAHPVEEKTAEKTPVKKTKSVAYKKKSKGSKKKK